MSTWCVYMHENRVSGKKYIGVTSQTPERRWQNGYGYRESPRFFNAILKYGWDGFKHEVLYTGLTKDEAAQMEIALIEKYGTTDPCFGYNLDLGGGGISKKSVETRRKMSLARIGTHPTPETVEKLRASHIGLKQSDESRKKKSDALRGRKKSPEHAKKIGAAKSKAVLMLDDSGQVLAKFTSMAAAEEVTGVSFKNISSVCQGKRVHAGGYVWRYGA